MVRGAGAMVKQNRAPPVGLSSTQISWPWASTNALAIESPTPVPPEVPLRLNMRNTLVRSARGHTGSSVFDGHLHQTVLAPLRRHRDGGMGWGVADGVVEEIGQHLSDQEVIDVHEGEVVIDGRGDVGRMSTPSPSPRSASVTRSPTAIGSLRSSRAPACDAR